MDKFKDALDDWIQGEDVTAEELLNETEIEPFTIEERTDLNIKECVGK
jgi:hypothetical protein